MTARQKHKVLVLFDSAGTPPADQDFSRELKTDDWATEAHVIDALKKLGHEVRTIGVYEDPGLIISEVKAHPPDVVFNLAEHFNARSAYDRNVAGLLEMLDLPYTGSGPAGRSGGPSASRFRSSSNRSRRRRPTASPRTRSWKTTRHSKSASASFMSG